MRSAEAQRRTCYLLALCLVLATGIFLRLPASLFEGNAGPLSFLSPLHPNPGFNGIGFDESLYRGYVNSVIRDGLGEYPGDRRSLHRGSENSRRLHPAADAVPLHLLGLPLASGVWDGSTRRLADVASLFSILALLLAAIFAWRLKGPVAALAVAALVAVAPTQIHMSQHALVDGFFAFWAVFTLWMVWENLRAPHDWRWLLPYTLGLTLMVLTKENAAFVFFALLVLLVANRWLKWGEVTRELLAVTVIGPLLGLALLIVLAGGPATLLAAYQLSVTKNYYLVYAITTGDGPWHRYLVDLLLVSPIILLLALGTVFRLDRTQKPELFLSIFIAASYLVMCNIKYGMNLRYANMWDTPLRILAFSQLTALVQPFTRHRTVLLGAAVALVCAVELRQYLLLFVEYGLHELVSEGLLRALQILKSVPAP